MTIALERHYVRGHDEQTACFVAGVDRSNFNKAASKLNVVAETMERLIEIRIGALSNLSKLNELE